MHDTREARRGEAGGKGSKHWPAQIWPLRENVSVCRVIEKSYKTVRENDIFLLGKLWTQLSGGDLK